MSTTDVISGFLDGIQSAALPKDVFCDDVLLDATVPNWRFCVRGASAVLAELGKWYAHPGYFEEVRRSEIPEGEVVEFTLRWEEDEVPHACHQAHVLRLHGGRIATDTVFCGGRWPEPLLAQIEAAQRVVQPDAVPTP